MGRENRKEAAAKPISRKRMEAKWDEQQRWQRQVDAECLKSGVEECNMGRR